MISGKDMLVATVVIQASVLLEAMLLGLEDVNWGQVDMRSVQTIFCGALCLPRTRSFSLSISD